MIGICSSLPRLVRDFAAAIERADSRRPQAADAAGEPRYEAELGPHAERRTLELVIDELVTMDQAYAEYALDVPYPGGRPTLRLVPRLHADMDWGWKLGAADRVAGTDQELVEQVARGQRIGVAAAFGRGILARIEAKLLRLLGDNGKANWNMPTHILSPTPKHNSALTVCQEVAGFSIAASKALLIFGYEYDLWPMDPAIEALESLTAESSELGPRHEVRFDNLIHRWHARGRVYAWEIGPTADITGDVLSEKRLQPKLCRQPGNDGIVEARLKPRYMLGMEQPVDVGF